MAGLPSHARKSVLVGEDLTAHFAQTRPAW
jgi:hypothetical protein